MAAGTGGIHMCASQFKAGQIMVECGRRPCLSGMTGGAGRSQYTLVDIILGMTGIAFRRCPLKQLIDMAIGAWDKSMLAGQLENRQIMIESRRGPISGGMALAAELAQITQMDVILGMAGIAVLRSCLHLGNGMVPRMTLYAGDLQVFPGQGVRGQAVVECVAVRINSIVAAQAITPIRLQMRLHEISLDLSVAGGANGLVECSVAARMAIRTGKWTSIGSGQVSRQRVSKGGMIDLDFTHIHQ